MASWPFPGFHHHHHEGNPCAPRDTKGLSPRRIGLELRFVSAKHPPGAPRLPDFKGSG